MCFALFLNFQKIGFLFFHLLISHVAIDTQFYFYCDLK